MSGGRKCELWTQVHMHSSSCTVHDYMCIHVYVQFNGALCITYMYVDVLIKLLYSI